MIHIHSNIINPASLCAKINWQLLFIIQSVKMMYFQVRWKYVLDDVLCNAISNANIHLIEACILTNMWNCQPCWKWKHLFISSLCF